jgi:hypothetical protein
MVLADGRARLTSGSLGPFNYDTTHSDEPLPTICAASSDTPDRHHTIGPRLDKYDKPTLRPQSGRIVTIRVMRCGLLSICLFSVTYFFFMMLRNRKPA